MKPEKVAISPAVLKELRRLVKTVWFTEIGGPMVGYLLPDATLVITDLAGPGPRGICRFYSVTIDGEHSKSFCDQAFTESGGLCDYVGDWHCHPSLSLQASQGDIDAMETMANTDGLTQYPVSLIYSRINHRMVAYRWEAEESDLVEIPISVSLPTDH